MTTTIRFAFDFLSPYAYLGWTQIHALAARHDAVVEPFPVLFAALLGKWGHKGPAEIPPKRVYVFKNTLRLAHRLGVPIAPPPSHPFNPLLALRVASLPGPTDRKAIIDALYRATWGGGDGVGDRDAVVRALGAAGLDGEALVAEAETDDAKARLRAQTDEAIAAGVFGVPTMLVGAELFWGVDSFVDLEAFLDGKDPASPEVVARYRELRASAVRRG